MNRFDYTAQCNGGAAMSGTIEAAGHEQALELLGSMGLCNIELHPAERPASRKTLGSADFIFFNEQLASLAGAGMCLDVGLRQLGRDIRSRRLKGVLESVADDVQHGRSLHEAIERSAPQLPALYARVVRAGVESGQLPATLMNLSHHLRLVAETRRLITEALTYPAIVLVLALGVFCAVFLLVVPQFVETFEDFDVRLPALTLAIIAFSRALPQYLIGAAILVLIAGLWYFLIPLSPNGHALRERLVLRVPVLGSLIRNSLRARFLRAMAFAMHTGLPMPEALRLSAGATGSPSLVQDAEEVASRVERGGDLDGACRNSRVVPPMFAYFVGVSGEHGDLRDGLIQLSKAYDSQALHAQSLLRSWFAPLAVVGVGLAIGFLILALFLPLVNLIQSVSGG